MVEDWFGFYALAKTPAPIIANANAAIKTALKEKSVIDSLALSGMVSIGGSAADMANSMKQYHDFWGPIVKKIDFTAES